MSAAERSPLDPDDGLPRSIFVPRTDPRGDLREVVDSILSDRFMAFLSILLVPIILTPLFFTLSSSVTDLLEVGDATIIVFFVVEYGAKLYLAQSRWDYFKSPWHLVDLAVVLLSFVSYLPFLGFQSKGSTTLLLRLLRLPRALAVGGRTAGSRVRTTETVQVAVEKPPETIIRQVGADLTEEHDGLSWEELEARLKTQEQEWIDIHNITEQGTLRLSQLLRVPPHHFRVKQVDDIYPRIDYFQKVSFIFVQQGELKFPDREDHYLTVARRGEVIVCFGPKVISTSQHGIDMFSRAITDAKRLLKERGFAVSVIYGVLDSTLNEYDALFSQIELEVAKIGSTQRSKLPKDFLQRMYEMNKEVVRLVSNLVHFKELLGVIISGRVQLEGLTDDAKSDFEDLQDETQYLNDIADDIVDQLRTIIELYINQSSFETNRILKILAVITSLAIIPSAISGLLGMNLLDVPYRFELWEVVVSVGITMSFVGYVFIKLGWLKS